MSRICPIFPFILPCDMQALTCVTLTMLSVNIKGFGSQVFVMLVEGAFPVMQNTESRWVSHLEQKIFDGSLGSQQLQENMTKLNTNN